LSKLKIKNLKTKGFWKVSIMNSREREREKKEAKIARYLYLIFSG
jgi:hypothetical protein